MLVTTVTEVSGDGGWQAIGWGVSSVLGQIDIGREWAFNITP